MGDHGSPTASLSLVTLPPEVQCLIVRNLVQYRDLNSLSISCKILNAITLPQLYHTIELKVPLKWNRLASLEKLLATSPEALRYTRSLHIITQQASIKDDRYGSLDDLNLADNEEDEEETSDDETQNGAFRHYVPGRWASSALNSLVRLLILKMSRQQLHAFRWNHECRLASLTLAVLLNNHGSSIQTLEFRQYTRKWKRTNSESLALANLTTLKIAALHTDEGTWPIQLLTKNYEKLRDLELSNETGMAFEHKVGGILDPNEAAREADTEDLITHIKVEFDALEHCSVPKLRLDSLSLCGFDLAVITCSPVLPIDFDNLSTLIIQSCSGLNEAFHLLSGVNPVRRNKVGVSRLRTLILRHENADSAFLLILRTFLESLNPLSTLHVMLEGYSDIQILGESIKPHGKSLESLIWDERSRPRTRIETDSTLPSNANLKTIAKHCTKLKSLGIPLSWQGLTDSENDHSKMASYFSKLRYLQTLNVRNLPEAPAITTWLPNDYMLDGLASMLLHIVSSKARAGQLPTLKTLGIGALTYGNVMIGVNHYPTNQFANFLQLRIYRVDYNYVFQGVRTPRLHMIAKGTPADAQGIAENLDLFDIYWLDGAPKKPRFLVQ